MFIIPVKIYLLAILSMVLILISCFRDPVLFLLIIGCLGNFIIFVGPSGIRTAMLKGGTMKRRHDLKRNSPPEHEAFHNCDSCGATDKTHPDRDFRIAEDDRELCGECIESNLSQ